jgi:predicted transcriptional regulator
MLRRAFDELPTLRMSTLRRLLRQTVPPIVIDPSTPIATVARTLAALPGATAVLVDASLVLRGTLAIDELDGPSDHAAEAIAVKTPMMEPETDLDSARMTMQLAGVDRVLVVAFNGQLLGVITRDDLDRAMKRSPITA